MGNMRDRDIEPLRRATERRYRESYVECDPADDSVAGRRSSWIGAFCTTFREQFGVWPTALEITAFHDVVALDAEATSQRAVLEAECST